jgi:hypothetical protein
LQDEDIDRAVGSTRQKCLTRPTGKYPREMQGSAINEELAAKKPATPLEMVVPIV